MIKRKRITSKTVILIIVALLLVLLVLFFPLKPVLRTSSNCVITSVTLYYKGAPQEDISDYLKLDDLSFLLRLYNTTIVPTSRDSRQMGDYYYVTEGTLNGKNFTIISDERDAVLHFQNDKLGYVLKNGNTFNGMLYSIAHNEHRAELRNIMLLND